MATDVATESATTSPEPAEVESDVADQLLEAVERGDDDAAWTRAQELARGVLANDVVTLARAVLEGGPLAVHRALKLAEIVNANANAEEAPKPLTTHDAVRW